MRSTENRSGVIAESLEIRRLLAGAVGGVVWNDANFNSLHDPAEKGASGRTVYADLDNDGKLDSSEARTVTDSGGKYILANLKSGRYPVRLLSSSKWNQSQPFNNYGNWITVVSGKTISGTDFGVYRKTAAAGGISGKVFYDTFYDQNADSDDPALGGRTVFVDYDGDKFMDSDEPRAKSLGNGTFQINHVLATTGTGRRPVRQILPDGWEQTAPVSEGWYPTTYDTTPAVGAAAWMGVSDGQVTRIVDTPPPFCKNPLFGSRPVMGNGIVVGRALMDEDGNGIFDNWNPSYRNPSITGAAVWVDYDNDGNLDADEPAARHREYSDEWGVELPMTAGQGSNTRVNEASYMMESVMPGRHPVKMKLMSGWVPTATIGKTAWVNVIAGETVQAADLLARPVGPFGKITTSVFHDRNRDGLDNDWTPDRSNSISGALLYVDLDRDPNEAYGALDPQDPVATTQYFSETGPSTRVSIEHLPPGKYLVRCRSPYGGQTSFWSSTTNTSTGVEVNVIAGMESFILPGFGMYVEYA